MSIDALAIITQITILAIGSRIGYPSLAPKMPTNAPIEESASERWCHASAIRAPELIFFAAPLVYQNIHSFTTMDTTAAISASVPGMAMVPPDVLFTISRAPVIPIPRPVTSSIPARTMEETHSILSCPYWCSLSDFFVERRTPMITMKVLPTSDAE